MFQDDPNGRWEGRGSKKAESETKGSYLPVSHPTKQLSHQRGFQGLSGQLEVFVKLLWFGNGALISTENV